MARKKAPINTKAINNKLKAFTGGASNNKPPSAVSYFIQSVITEEEIIKQMNKPICPQSMLSMLSLEDIPDTHCQEFINELMTLPDEKFDKIISNLIRLHEPVNKALELLFFTLKAFIEGLIIKHIPGLTVDQIKMEEFLSHKHIHSSSPLILLCSGQIDGAPKTSQHHIFINACKKYTYKGYCPRAPKERILELLKLPIELLVEDMDMERFKDILKCLQNEYEGLKLDKPVYVINTNTHKPIGLSDRLQEGYYRLTQIEENNIKLSNVIINISKCIYIGA